ncbi:MAG TPA: biotin transporter BioY [Acidobacteriota bacterium]|nr:biotin transporter BioY [Acidobacteriota bacterium]
MDKVSAQVERRVDAFLIHLFGALFFALLTILSAQIRIPLPFTPVPMTLQTFVVPLAGGFLGIRWGVASMLLYLIFGFVDANAFAAINDGSAFLFAPTSGYLLGFVFAAAVMGWTRDQKVSNAIVFAGLLLANLLIFACGMLGLTINASMTVQDAWLKGVVPFLAGGILKLAADYLVLISYRAIRKI